MNNSLLKDVLNLIKKEHNFPPLKPLDEFLNSSPKPRNLTQISIPPRTAQYCAQLIKSIFQEYTDKVFCNLRLLELQSDADVHEALNSALKVLFTEASEALEKQFTGGSMDRVKLALPVLDQELQGMQEELQLRIRTRHLQKGDRMPSITIQDSKNINLVVSSLNTSINQIIQHGGPDAEAGRLLQEFVEMVGEIKDHAKEQKELLDLARGLLKELQEPKEERNETTMKVFLEKIKAVGSTVTGAADILQFVTDKIPRLLSLLNLGS